MSLKITEQAIAYLKGSPPDNHSAIQLPWKDEPIIRPLFDGLHICYLVEKGQKYEYVQNRHLEEDEISADELHQVGLHNLKQLFIKKNAKVQPYGNIFAFLASGDFEASALLLDEFWDGKFREFVIGEYAVAMPSRDVFAFCDASSKEGISELQQMINRIWPTNDHLVSNKIYIRKSTGWKKLELV